MSLSASDIASVKLIVGMEVHVELATRTKMFTRAPNPAHPDFDPHAEHDHVGHAGHDHAPHRAAVLPNTLIDPTVLALPGALPVMNKAAVEMSIKVGLALQCQIAPLTKWDRKGYFYPDLPKAYQISQYDLPLCFDGSIDVPALDAQGQLDLDAEPTRIGIIRAHLEEDAGKLLHEAPGGGEIDFSIADYNRAGAPLLEIVTQPDFTSADQCVAFCRVLRNVCRFLGVSEGVMQKGHMRFEPNINTHITLKDGHLIKTPVVEVKNLNSFKAVKGAIEFELEQQPLRWLADKREMGRGMKQTRGWNDHARGGKGETFLQREKEDAHDYRYFPDPDLVPVVVDEAWKSRIAATIPELPLNRYRRYMEEFGLGKKEAAALVDERDVCFFYEGVIAAMEAMGLSHARSGKLAANILLQSGAKRANEQQRLISDLGITPESVAAIGKLREDGKLSNQGVDELFGILCEEKAEEVHRGGRGERGERQGVQGTESIDGANASPATFSSVPNPSLSFSASSASSAVNVSSSLAHAEATAKDRGLLLVRDDAALAKWVDQAIAENAQAAADVKAGKVQAVGRLVGAVVKLSGGTLDAKNVRDALLAKLSNN
jgi:aspartyl-tRNA(Asn)/glutamyl-tRNA(Gln) amidotransferase subunit B